LIILPIITLKVSITGTASRIIEKVKSIFFVAELVDEIRTAVIRKNPKVREPLSPRKILAGKILYFKNPIREQSNKVSGEIDYSAPIQIKVMGLPEAAKSS
jgi:hypothetical protein